MSYGNSLFIWAVYFAAHSTKKTLVLADIPVHCVQPEVVGLWRFHVGTYHGANGPDSQCGYSAPDNPDGHHQLTPPNSPNKPANGNYFLTDAFKKEFTLQVLLKDWTSRVVSVDAAGRQHFPDDVGDMAGGEWTMIYDEGFHINVGSSKQGQHSFLAFSKYMLGSGSYAGSTDNFGNRKQSYCGYTLLGWYKQVDPTTGLVKRQQCWWGERIQSLHEALSSLPAALTADSLSLPPILPLPLRNNSAADKPAKDQKPGPTAMLRGHTAHDGQSSMAIPFMSSIGLDPKILRRGLQLSLALSVTLGLVATYQFAVGAKDGKETGSRFSFWHVVAILCGIFALGMTGALWYSPGVASGHTQSLNNSILASTEPIMNNAAPLPRSQDANSHGVAKRKVNITEAAYRQHAGLREARRNGTAVRWQTNPEKFKQWLRERQEKHGMSVHEGSTVDEILDAFAPRRSVSVGDYGFATEQVIGPVRAVAIKQQIDIAKKKGKTPSQLTTEDVKDGWTISDTNHHKERTFSMDGQVLQPEGWQTLKDFDWRKVSLQMPDGKSIRNFVNAVPDQGGCGSCYAVAATSMLTSRLMLKYPELHKKFAAERGADRISVEQQLGCNPYNQGCSGGYPYLVSAWSSFNNLVSRDCIDQRPGKSNGTRNDHSMCDSSKLSGEACKEQFRVKNWHYVGGSLGRCGLHHLCEDAIREELYKGGPLAVSVEPTAGFGYASGVFHGVPGMEDKTMLSEVHSSKDKADCSDTECYAWRKVDHSVLLVGWGEDLSQGKTCQARVHRVEKSEDIYDAGCEKIHKEEECRKKTECVFRGFPYWTIQNSYGLSFGEEGYLRFGPRGQDPMRVEAMTLAADVVWTNRHGGDAEEASELNESPGSSMLSKASVLAEATRHLNFGS